MSIHRFKDWSPRGGGDSVVTASGEDLVCERTRPPCSQSHQGGALCGGASGRWPGDGLKNLMFLETELHVNEVPDGQTFCDKGLLVDSDPLHNSVAPLFKAGSPSIGPGKAQRIREVK